MRIRTSSTISAKAGARGAERPEAYPDEPPLLSKPMSPAPVIARQVIPAAPHAAVQEEAYEDFGPVGSRASRSPGRAARVPLSESQTLLSPSLAPKLGVPTAPMIFQGQSGPQLPAFGNMLPGLPAAALAPTGRRT